ncbi:alpha/beta fold hydrolase (macronuclear) [Tetrahymena thermophila SB210]|uniref:Alpha/beta fold hydrolase n=1 Tax=Tetrahymena thermophila (strain SB210) TaxID=312017 RepID=I7LV32_TETTS|nr:alpha/beta fold hydrolase [Tetrahymena thermophila SB210]EAR97111.1 alpha/beta fold hydrolase [Tetrahymena thermophila SB210]|eukprot:XP_001017356.1 alpha/beta fold hydrolase [Tetrahymena thermophila SB210]
MGQNSAKNQNVTKNKHYVQASNKEKEIIQKYTNLKIGENLRILNVEFKFNGKDTFIHTLVSGEQNQQVIVLIHGYLATSLFYYKIIENLSQNYKVYSIDLLGMGLSDRQNIEFQQPKNAEVATQLFVDSLEEWRKALGIQSFKLFGHSFGGFISFNYNLQYPERVEQIILISPMSGSSVQPKYDLRDKQKFKKYSSSLTFKQSLFPKFLRCMHEKKMTLSKFLQSSLIPSDYFVNKIIDQRFEFQTKQEKEDWKIYFKSIQMLPECTDHLIHEFVSMPYVQPKISIEEIILSGKMKEQHIPIHYIYGGQDWMDWSGTKRLLSNQQIIGTIDYIKDAGHLIPFEQPEYLVKEMLEIFQNQQYYFNQMKNIKKQKQLQL